MPALLWDVYCRVIDNLGDAGVCWRLAAGLAASGQRVRLVIDDAAPLAFMAPQGTRGVEVLPWPGPAEAGDVVIEAFGCDPPPATVEAMARRAAPPVWINLEYLSAEDYVERSHGLPSPQRNGLTKWFFYPGFTARTGGLLREPDLAVRRASFDRNTWLQLQGITLRPGERVVTLFCYDNPAIPALLNDLAAAPTLLLLTPGAAQQQVSQAPPTVRLHALPWLTQVDFDALLWSSDLNFVRGEDSLVRAIWAGVPFVWQAYPQHDTAHAAKLQALLQRMQAPPGLAAAWLAWNGLGPAWPGVQALQPEPFRQLRASLWAQDGLVTQLLSFVSSRPRPGPAC
jgi:uncharacterized repeat protein (TIGR03837 family)